MKRKYIKAIIFTAVVALPFIADACPLCQAGATKRAAKAYEETTALLALLPILGGGGIFYWFYTKSKSQK